MLVLNKSDGRLIHSGLQCHAHRCLRMAQDVLQLVSFQAPIAGIVWAPSGMARAGSLLSMSS